MEMTMNTEKKVHFALYRKYRPQDFNNLVGQKHVQQALSTSLENGTPSHAYLFTGPRGTGKTSSALLFARALNCKNPQNNSACGECSSCKNSEDIIERDAATYTSVESIREMNASLGYSPMYGKYKIIILDEVHMLSGGAFNALLKTLEEPPAHVIFILATTEVHKVPATILSRCQRFDFKRISNQEIVDRLAFIAKNEGITIDDNSLNLIAQCAVGGLRDAIGLLDQASSMTADKVVTMDLLLDLTGSVDVNITGRLIRDILSGSIENALQTFSKAFESKEPKFFIEEMLIYIRDILMVKKVGPTAPLKKAYLDKDFSSVVELLSTDKAYDLLDGLQAAINEINYAQDVNLFVELLIIKLISNDRAKSLQAQIDELREMITSGNIAVSPTTNNQDGWSTETRALLPTDEQMITIPNAIPVQENVSTMDTSTTEQSIEEDNNPVGNANVIPEFNLNLMGSIEGSSIPTFEETATVDETHEEIVVSDPINFMKQAEEYHEQGKDWTSIPIETPAHEKDEFNPPLASEGVGNIPTNENTFTEPVEDVLSNHVPELMEAPPVDEQDAPPPAATEDDRILIDVSNIILSDKQRDVLAILQSANANERSVLESKQSAILETLKSSLSTAAIYREFTIKAVNETHIVLTHNEKAKTKLINVVKNRSLIEGAIEDNHKALSIVPITTKEWLEVVAVYKSQK